MSTELLNRDTLATLIARAGLQGLSPQQLDDMLPTYALLKEMMVHARPLGGYEAEPSAVFAPAMPAGNGSL